MAMETVDETTTTEKVISTCDEGSAEAYVRKVLIIVFSVLIVLSNCLLIILISKNEKLRKKVLCSNGEL